MLEIWPIFVGFYITSLLRHVSFAITVVWILIVEKWSSHFISSFVEDIQFSCFSIYIISDFIRPICLPQTKEQQTNSYDGYEMEVAGWGKTEKGQF